MVAEAPDPHRGDPGRLEEVRNGFIGADTVGHKKVLEKGVDSIFCFNKHTIKLFSSAMEHILQKVIAYVGHPVYWACMTTLDRAHAFHDTIFS